MTRAAARSPANAATDGDVELRRRTAVSDGGVGWWQLASREKLFG
jgi:hypothetical protein